MKIVILDNGHGKETPGKRSPVWSDGSQLFEWEFNRDVVRRIAAKLKAENIPFSILVPETNDVTLGERCRRANAIYAKNNKEAFLVSVHANAGGGTGWEVYTARRNESRCYRHGICRGSATGICPGRLAYAVRLFGQRPR